MKPWIIVFFLGIGTLVGVAHAAEPPSGTSQEILQLNETVKEKKSQLEEVQQKIETYKVQISKLQNQSISLANQIALIENQIAKTELDIRALGLRMDTVTAEIAVLDQEVTEKQQLIDRDRDTTGTLVREIRRYDDHSPLMILFGGRTFSDFYTHLHFLEEVQTRLQETLDDIKAAQQTEEKYRHDREDEQLALQKLHTELQQKRATLDDAQGSKEYLLAATQASQAKFEKLVTDLRAESQLVDAQLGTLQARLSARLKSYDTNLPEGNELFSWPLAGDVVITTLFHDPNYPFRRLFEHSGIDVRASVGTPILAAAPGIVAMARTGKGYGNYVVLIHSNGLSTLYAHLSHILVVPDQFVARGETIGLSGGAHGMQGAGLSTGPHLHFEVRSEGIPTNPLEYLQLPASVVSSDTSTD